MNKFNRVIKLMPSSLSTSSGMQDPGLGSGSTAGRGRCPSASENLGLFSKMIKKKKICCLDYKKRFYLMNTEEKETN